MVSHCNNTSGRTRHWTQSRTPQTALRKWQKLDTGEIARFEKAKLEKMEMLDKNTLPTREH